MKILSIPELGRKIITTWERQTTPYPIENLCKNVISAAEKLERRRDSPLSLKSKANILRELFTPSEDTTSGIAYPLLAGNTVPVLPKDTLKKGLKQFLATEEAVKNVSSIEAESHLGDRAVFYYQTKPDRKTNNDSKNNFWIAAQPKADGNVKVWTPNNGEIDIKVDGTTKVGKNIQTLIKMRSDLLKRSAA